MDEVAVQTLTAEETTAVGRALGRAMPSGLVARLSGPLGVGKTTLAQGVALGLGVAEPVVSPSFVIAREYQARDGRRLVHVDLYRLRGAAEVQDLGLEDVFDGETLVVIEWPEHGAGVLPETGLLIELRYAGSGRRISMAALDQVGVTALQRLELPEELSNP